MIVEGQEMKLAELAAREAYWGLDLSDLQPFAKLLKIPLGPSMSLYGPLGDDGEA